MCSYHNGNRLHLPHDLQLQRSLHLALKSRDDNENDDASSLHLALKSRDDNENDDARRHQNDDLDDDDHDMETDNHDELEENHASHVEDRMIYGASGGSTKRSRQSQVHEDAC
ncbi:hypothetical protein like AT1G21200 [Hibiscus trionum]|uniref:Uncharacterized protein n=1 Tax=Hibiscus trionum TaxID=183268 RepID=A0A9W7MUX8_HIBTR|nr:hypothetical protein like AT1G21200 [Hibiscus trionum]